MAKKRVDNATQKPAVQRTVDALRQQQDEQKKPQSQLDSALYQAVMTGGPRDLILALITELDPRKGLKKANPLSGLFDNTTPLHVAAAKGDAAAVVSMIEHLGYAKKSQKDRDNTIFIPPIPLHQLDNFHRQGDRETPLHVAVKAGALAVVKLLVEEYEIPLNLLNKTHETPLHAAQNAGKEAIADYLRSRQPAPAALNAERIAQRGSQLSRKEKSYPRQQAKLQAEQRANQLAEAEIPENAIIQFRLMDLDGVKLRMLELLPKEKEQWMEKILTEIEQGDKEPEQKRHTR